MTKKDCSCRFKYSEPDVTELMPNLFLGNVKIANDKEFISNKKIGTIIRVLENDDGSREVNILSKKIESIDYHIIPIKDVDACSIDLNHILDSTSEIIKDSLKQDVPILVHCKRGHHRSAVIIGAFMIKHHSNDYITTVKYINNRRRCALRRDTCMVRALFKYYLYNTGKEFTKITPYKDDEDDDIYNYTFS